VVSRLVELAEENAELDFTGVFKACLKDPDEEVREKAIEGLWEFEDRSLIPTLLELLKGDPSERVRASAATALGKFASLAQEGKLLSRDGERVLESLLEVLQSEEEPLEVRRRALEGVAPFNTPKVKDYIRWAYNSQELKLRCSAIFAMGRSGELSWLPFITKELKNPSPAIRYEAANACGELGNVEAVPHLIPLLQDDDWQVQVSAARALGEIGGPLAKKALKRCIKDADDILREAATEALENIEAMEDPLSFKYEL
jgi:HEAT repeat protein